MIKEILDVRTGKREQFGGSGGSTELKLVATGTYFEEDGGYYIKVDNNLEQNKWYLVTINDIEHDYTYSSFTILITGEYSKSVGTIPNTTNIVDVVYNKGDFEGEGFTFYDPIEEKSYSPSNLLLEVYELPFTLGGAE